MVAIRLVKVFSIAALVTFLVSSAESAEEVKCPVPKDSVNSKSEKLENFVVMFKPKVKENVVQTHFEMLDNCYGTKVRGIKEKGKVSLSSENKELVNLSAGGAHAYALKMSKALADGLDSMEEIALVEKEIKFTTQYALPNKFTRRAEDDNPTDNIDRIDQAKFPLDGKYVFPDSAGKGVNIFVVDTGIRTTHSEFGGRAKIGGSFCDGCNDEDENGHGTHVSSIAAGKTLGVARSANLFAVRVLDANGSGSNAGVIAGLNFVLDQHTSGKSKNTVVNMSLGGAKSQAVNNAVKQLTDAGVHVVVAAGNESQDACNTSPASELSAITVGATELDSDDITDFSNTGKCVDIFAPGRDIRGAGIKNDNEEVVFSGTSQACPHVAGTVALIIAKGGNKSPAAMAGELGKLSTKGVVKGIGKTGSPDSFLRVPAP